LFCNEESPFLIRF